MILIATLYWKHIKCFLCIASCDLQNNPIIVNPILIVRKTDNGEGKREGNDLPKVVSNSD